MTKKSQNYNLFSHTVDLGMLIRGRSCEELFKNAGLALIDPLVNNNNFKVENKVDISIRGNDLSDLMVKWLVEILYLFEGERLIVTKIMFNQYFKIQLIQHYPL